MSLLSKATSVPLYQQLVEVIKEQIDTGELQPGDKLLTENELSEKYEVSRITVRKAVEMLVEDGLISKKQGVGTFVCAPKLTRNIPGVMGFTQNCELEGKKPGTQLLQMEIVEAGAGDIARLKLDSGDRVIRIMRLRSCDDVPVMLEENRFSLAYDFLLHSDLNGSLYALLQANGIEIARGVKDIGICLANEQESALLEVEQGTCLLLVKDVAYDRAGNPVHTSKHIINPERFHFVVETS